MCRCLATGRGGGWLTRRTDWSTGPFCMFSQDVFSVVDSSVILITLLLECNFIFISYSVSSVKMVSKRKSVTVTIGTKKSKLYFVLMQLNRLLQLQKS